MSEPTETTTKTVPLAQRRQQLRKFRKEYGITLANFGKLAGVSQPMLSRFERGRRDLSPEAWTRVLQTMGKLLDEDEKRRRAKRAKAEQTAAKLGVLLYGGLFDGRGSAEAYQRREKEAMGAATYNKIYAPLFEVLRDELQKFEKLLDKQGLTPEQKEARIAAEFMPDLAPLQRSIEKYLVLSDQLRKQREAQASPGSLKAMLSENALRQSLAAEKNLVLQWEESSARGKTLLRKAAELPPDLLEHPVIKELIESYQRELEEKDKAIELLKQPDLETQ